MPTRHLLHVGLHLGLLSERCTLVTACRTTPRVGYPATQVYCYSTIREWFKTGNRLCPRTNIEVQDVQVGVTSRDEGWRGLRKATR